MRAVSLTSPRKESLGITDNPFRMLALRSLIASTGGSNSVIFQSGAPPKIKNREKNSLDSRSRWGILADIEFWSKARLSQSLDLGTFSIL